MQLYKITNEYQSALSTLLEMELTPEEIQDNLAAIQQDFDTKALNIAAFIKNLELNIESLKKYEDSIKERRKSIENKIDKIKTYLIDNMQQLNIKKVSGVEFDVSIRKSPPHVIIEDEKNIDPDYFINEWVSKLNKEKIRLELMNGKEISGAKLQQRVSLTIK